VTIAWQRPAPSISTSAFPSSATVGIRELQDFAWIGVLVNPVTSGPGTGTITFNVYDPNAPNCTGTPFFAQTLLVDRGGNS
jgi:hypothetical protein